MCCFTYHVSLFFLEPTGNLEIISLWANITATLHALFKLTEWTLKPGHLEEDCSITTFSENEILNFFFAYGPCNNIHQFEGYFLRGQVSSNGFKNFNGWIVQYLNFIGLSAKTLENVLFWENVVIEQSSSKCPVWLSALQYTSLVLMVFLPTVMLLKWFSVYRLLAAATQINANN